MSWTYLLTGLQLAEPADEELHFDTRILDTDVVFERLSLRYVRSGLSVSEQRLAFRIGTGAQDDKLAAEIAEALELSLAVVNDLIKVVGEHFSALRIPSNLLLQQVPWSQLESETRAAPEASELSSTELVLTLGTALFVRSSEVNAMLPYVAVATTEPWHSAASYYARSLGDFAVNFVQLRDTVESGDELELDFDESARLEQALHNSFKAVEALVGEPNNDKMKFRRKLEAVGLDPDERLGWGYGGVESSIGSLLGSIRRLHKARDRQAAHAKTPNRNALTYQEMAEFQMTARAFLLRWAEAGFP